METIKSKKGSSPARCPGEFSWTCTKFQRMWVTRQCGQQKNLRAAQRNQHKRAKTNKQNKKTFLKKTQKKSKLTFEMVDNCQACSMCAYNHRRSLGCIPPNQSYHSFQPFEAHDGPRLVEEHWCQCKCTHVSVLKAGQFVCMNCANTGLPWALGCSDCRYLEDCHPVRVPSLG